MCVCVYIDIFTYVCIYVYIYIYTHIYRRYEYEPPSEPIQFMAVMKPSRFGKQPP